MVTFPPYLLRICVVLPVLLWSPAEPLVAQTVQLTHDPVDFYLPSDIQIEHLAPIGVDRYVAVWGTTWQPGEGEFRTRLVWQMVGSASRYGEPAVLTTSSAEPYGMVSAVTLPAGVLVFWWDRRASAKGTWARFLPHDGGGLSEEIYVDQRYFWSVELLDTLPDGDLRILFNSGKGSRILRVSSRGIMRDQDVALEQRISNVFSDRTGSFSRILLLADGTALPLGFEWTVDPYERIPAGRITGHWYRDEGGAIWVQDGARLNRFRNWTTPEPDTTILLPGSIAGGVIFAGFEEGHPRYIRVSSMTDPPLEMHDVDYQGGWHRVYAQVFVLRDGRKILRGDTVQISNRHIFRYSSGRIVYFSLSEVKGIDLYAGNSLPSRVSIRIEERHGTSHYPGSEWEYSHLLKIDMEA